MRIVGTGIATLLILMTAALADGIGAQTTPYVPNLDPAYLDLDLLVAEGLVRQIVVGERPYSRAAFARFATEATDRAGLRGGALQPRTREALDRLIRRFASEGQRGDLETRRVRPRGAHLEMSTASSPDRDLRPGTDSGIDGTVNPLLQVNQGRAIANGHTGAAEAVLDFDGGVVAGQLRPRVWFGAPRAAGGGSATLVDAYARTVVGPVALDVGRNHVVLGYGKEGGPMLSHNARGLDMVRLAADRPVRLPGPLGVLGLWQASALVADMGTNRDVRGSVLTIFRLSGRPSRYVEFGINYLNHQGGEGPEATWADRIQDMFFFWRDGGAVHISDKVVGADLRLTVPALRTELYVNLLTTDTRGRFRQPAGGLWEDAIWSVGTHVFGLGSGGRYDARIEWTHAGVLVHTHGQFTSGLTLDGRVLGDALGPNAWSVQGGVDRTGPDSRLSVTGAWELYSGDDWHVGPIPGRGRWDWDWFLLADNPDEIRKRITVDWTHLAGLSGIETSIRLGYEHVTRYKFSGANRSNFLAQVKVGYIW